MRALVTGVAGFIGSRLAARLLDEGHDVAGVDCLTPYYDPDLKRANLAVLTGRDGFRFDEADLREAELEPLVAVDTVFHLAAQPGVRSSWGPSFRHYLKHNVWATQRLLEACRAAETPRVVFASSSSVYGEAERHPTPEDLLLRPISPYGVTKVAAEHLFAAYASSFGVSSAWVRYFTVYGPGQRPDMAFHRFIRAAFAGESVEVYGDGEQTRDVTFVDDAVVATIAAATAGLAGPVNVGGGAQVSVNRVLELVRALTGRPVEVVRRDPQAGDVRHTSADLTRARDALGWEPAVGIEDGLREQVEWQRPSAGS